MLKNKIFPGVTALFMLAVPFIHAPAAIHMSSTVSDGQYTISELVGIAKKNGIKVAIITDRDQMKWEYGLWPLRKIIKKTVEEGSVLRYGAKNYLKEIEAAQKENPDIVLIPGVESAPFYYWEGNPLANNLKIFNWHKHMLIIGMEKESDYRNLPLVSNRKGLVLPFGFKDIFYLWPVIILIAGIYCLRKRKFNYTDAGGRSLGPHSLPWQIFGGILIATSLVLLFENFPFRSYKFDQYSGDKGVLPYQNLIDYANRRGGLTFWAHPDIANISQRGNVGIETPEHGRDLLSAQDYTGFAIFYEGYKETGRPGGIWDQVLNEFCEGKRKSPVWTIGGMAFDHGDLNFLMRDVRTVILAPHLDKAEVLNALKQGRMYVLLADMSLILDKFEVNLVNKPAIEISGHFADGRKDIVQINLIRNGTIVKTFEAAAPFNIKYDDNYFEKGKKTYYRLEIRSPKGQLFSNPIFAVPAGRQVEFK